jgi:AcrR family transcriptional regulator
VITPETNKTRIEGPIKEPRGARRKRKTRQKLLDAALHLMAENGMEGVSINQITEAADVGFGSFYNHFPSKDAVYETLQEEMFGQFGDAIDAQIALIEDPAEKISIGLRHTMLRAKQNPDWAKFLILEGFSVKALSSGMAVRLARDVALGMQSGRFRKNDPELQILSIGATTLACMSSQISFSAANAKNANWLAVTPNNEKDFAERLVINTLIGLGITEDEASRVSRIPLPAAIEEQSETP